MSGEGELEFFNSLLPNTNHLFKGVVDIERSIRQATRRVQMIAFTIDWNSMDKVNTNIFAVGENSW